MPPFKNPNVRYRHEAIADLMLENPQMRQNAIALQLNFTQPYLSTIVNSDGFTEYFALRRIRHEEKLSEHVLTRDDRTIREKTESVASLALDAIEAKITVQGGNLPLKELNETAGRTLTALGFGSAPGGDRGRSGNTQINVYTGAVTPADLARARQRMEEDNANANATTTATDDAKVIEHESGTKVPATG
ncbi:MAG: hypothetical protein IIB38_03875 [Candidatus Hydrogenedentes bacterium]|nr:hypothetical protein [Candidatus Hydrogenedentota bacterium]